MNDDQRLINQPQGSQGSIVPDKPSGNHKKEMATQKTQRPTATTGGVGKKAPASSRKIAANRRNASKSTGPRTEIGKRTVAKNALKHGFFSKWLLIPHPDGREDPTEYQDFYAALREHYQPLDFLEELWVDKIASWSWRLRRLLRCESGQIARALAEHNHETKQLSAADSGELALPALSSPEIDAITDHLFLPPKEELDKLLRYEAMINKQLNHAIAELERLQRRGNGESVPAPISVDISGRD